MDIFTTVLTRVVQTPIKPERVRVKALSKEPAMNELTDDLDHLENHEQYVDLSKEDSEKKQNKQHQNQHEEKSSLYVDEASDGYEGDTATVIIHKEELIHPKKKYDEPDEDIHHLDIFV
jgi:Na+-translocating ferredoxin:NAD+ oxidoreductase RnfG subunit